MLEIELKDDIVNKYQLGDHLEINFLKAFSQFVLTEESSGKICIYDPKKRLKVNQSKEGTEILLTDINQLDEVFYLAVDTRYGLIINYYQEE